jgi:hypothetical protein
VNWVIYYFSFSVLIAGLIALFKFSRINRDYYPFIFIIWLGGLTEIASDQLFRNGYGNYLSSNIYVFFETLLYLWFFHNFGSFSRKPFLVFVLGVLFILLWVVDNFWFHPIDRTYCSYFNLAHSIFLVFLGINMINNLIIREKELLKHPVFWICIGVVIFFTYFILVEIFWLYGLSTNIQFGGKVYAILSWVNLICNLIYAVAILWMRKRQAFSVQF